MNENNHEVCVMYNRLEGEQVESNQAGHNQVGHNQATAGREGEKGAPHEGAAKPDGGRGALFQGEKELKKPILDDAAYNILREHGTEAPFSSPLNDEKRPGVFMCKGCLQALFSADDKYDSGSGWPSFKRPIDEVVLGSAIDRRFGMSRQEVHCARCKGHLGHVFNDGPRPLGKRYCINGAAMTFMPSE